MLELLEYKNGPNRSAPTLQPGPNLTCYLRRAAMKATRVCSVANCSTPVSRSRKCDKHYRKELAARSPECSIKGCTRNSERRGMCDPHYRKALRGSLERPSDLPIPTDSGEVWKKLPSDDAYSVSSHGRVWGHPRLIRREHPVDESWTYPKMLKLGVDPLGYRRAGIRGTVVRVHVLVAETFLGPRGEGEVVCHEDGDPANNSIGNLYYGTQSENNYDSIRHGTNVNYRKTHCPAGHEYSPGNTAYGKRGDGRKFRICIECRRRRGRTRG